jgi:hypothetical protein
VEREHAGLLAAVLAHDVDSAVSRLANRHEATVAVNLEDQVLFAAR